MEFKHKPVLLKETIEGLNIRKECTYVDGTLGGAGHSKKILEKLEKHDLIDHAILVSNSSQEEEEVITNLRDCKIDDKISYFSTILVNKNRNTR